jgi:hypothetical protein
MSEGPQAGQQPLSHVRQITIDALCEHFANDVMSVEEFELRVEAAHKASTNEEVRRLLQDLPGADVPAVVQGQSIPATVQQEFGVTAAAHVKDQAFVVACLGGASRKGRWTPARRTYAIAVMGGTQLDFREAVFGPGTTEVQVFAVWGGVEIIVPPGITVESQGVAIMGGFDHLSDTPLPGAEDNPTVRITGLALMGGVDVTVRHPGESARDAKKRRRLERKELRRLGTGE